MSTTLRTASGDLVFPRVIVTDPATVALISIRDILGLWLNSWFLDTLAGVPWVQKILGVKNPNLTDVQSTLRKAILSAPYVISVTATALFNSSTRDFSYNFSARLDTGQTIVGGSSQAFHIQGEQ